MPRPTGCRGWWSIASAIRSRPRSTRWACISGPRRFWPGWPRLCGTRHTLVRPSPQFLSQEGQEPPEIASAELPEQVTIREYGTRFRVRFAGGHKTGFFCDQRENRRRLADFCGGRTVLDLCCYTGGFAVQAMRLGQAAEATGVDLDEEPLRLARENAHLNQVRVRFVQADVFTYMREMLAQGRQYDVVVLDPPKLVRSRTELEEGTRKHLDLNRLAMRLVKPGGLMLELLLFGPVEGARFPRPALFGRLSGRAAAVGGQGRRLRAARCAADADTGPQRRGGRSPGRLQRPGERVSQGGVDAAGVSDLPAPKPTGGDRWEGRRWPSNSHRSQPVGVGAGAITSPPPYSNTFSTGTMRMFSRLIFKGKRAISSSSFKTAGGRERRIGDRTGRVGRPGRRPVHGRPS